MSGSHAFHSESKAIYDPKQDPYIVGYVQSQSRPLMDLIQDFLDEKENADTILLNRIHQILERDKAVFKDQIIKELEEKLVSASQACFARYYTLLGLAYQIAEDAFYSELYMQRAIDAREPTALYLLGMSSLNENQHDYAIAFFQEASQKGHTYATIKLITCTHLNVLKQAGSQKNTLSKDEQKILSQVCTAFNSLVGKQCIEVFHCISEIYYPLLDHLKIQKPIKGYPDRDSCYRATFKIGSTYAVTSITKNFVLLPRWAIWYYRVALEYGEDPDVASSWKWWRDVTPARDILEVFGDSRLLLDPKINLSHAAIKKSTKPVHSESVSPNALQPQLQDELPKKQHEYFRAYDGDYWFVGCQECFICLPSCEEDPLKQRPFFRFAKDQLLKILERSCSSRDYCGACSSCKNSVEVFSKSKLNEKEYKIDVALTNALKELKVNFPGPLHVSHSIRKEKKIGPKVVHVHRRFVDDFKSKLAELSDEEIRNLTPDSVKEKLWEFIKARDISVQQHPQQETKPTASDQTSKKSGWREELEKKINQEAVEHTKIKIKLLDLLHQIRPQQEEHLKRLDADKRRKIEGKASEDTCLQEWEELKQNKTLSETDFQNKAIALSGTMNSKQAEWNGYIKRLEAAIHNADKKRQAVPEKKAVASTPRTAVAVIAQPAVAVPQQQSRRLRVPPAKPKAQSQPASKKTRYKTPFQMFREENNKPRLPSIAEEKTKINQPEPPQSNATENRRADDVKLLPLVSITPSSSPEPESAAPSSALDSLGDPPAYNVVMSESKSADSSSAPSSLSNSPSCDMVMTSDVESASATPTPLSFSPELKSAASPAAAVEPIAPSRAPSGQSSCRLYSLFGALGSPFQPIEGGSLFSSMPSSLSHSPGSHVVTPVAPIAPPRAPSGQSSPRLYSLFGALNSPFQLIEVSRPAPVVPRLDRGIQKI